MKDFDLDAQLQALRLPERGGEYWADFPRRVTGELRSRPLPRPVRSSWLPQLAWGFSLAFGCFALGYYLGHNEVPRGITHAWIQHQKEIAKFQTQINSYDEHGLRKLLTDQH